MKLFSFSPDDDRLIKAIRDSGQADLPVGAQQRLVHRLQADMTSVRFASQARYKGSQRSVFNQLTSKPMIAIVIAAIILLTGSGTVIAADSAKPGDVLFGIDRATERTRLAVTFGDEAKARLRTDIAEEREQERLKLLEDNDSEHAQEAEELANEALTHAIETISEVRLKLEAKGNPGKAVEALAEVEAKLRAILDLRNQSDQQESDDDDTGDVNGNANANRDVNTNANVNANANGDDDGDDDQSNSNADSSDDDGDDEDRSGPNRGPSGSNSNQSGDDDQDDDRGNSNSNRSDDDDEDDDRNANANVNVNANTNADSDDGEDEDNSGSGNDDDSDNATVQRIEVKVEDGRAEIKVRTGGEDDEWQLNTNDETTILLSIAAKTGLTSAQIQAIWEYEVGD